MRRIRFCASCDKYTLKQRCDACGKETTINAPQKYAKDEEIARYRREIKRVLLKERGIL
ncbi:MAG: RNA-protein complex protein Nop10 [Candidatus Parvarchaeota archaeon]|nr:RNA-protein complex protein Nop10 [Candidatus Parvarchaeota archaeon]